MSKIKCVYLEWEDHCSTSPAGGGAWSQIEHQDNTPSKIKTVGFIVKEDKKYITICSCYDATYPDDANVIKGVSIIIKSCITKRRVIKL